MTCLNEKHWLFFDINCKKCRDEVKKSGLLTQSEYDDWLKGKFALGFNLKRGDELVV